MITLLGRGVNSLGNLSYTYDLAGRRTSVGGSLAAVNLPNAISTTAYDAANELTQWGTATPTYDANGNTLSDGTNTYVWNARNQLASMNLTGETFQYDPFGRRVGKTILSTTTNYLYDGANPVQELSGTTPAANMLTGGIDEYFTRTDSTGTANFLTDALGSTISLTNSSGGALASYTYEPFGNTAASGSSVNTYQYTGRENDGTGVYFNRARYYSPMLQRFISEDPAGFNGGSTNLYTYAQNSPTNMRDSSGKNPACLIGGLLGTIAYNSYVIYRSTAGRYSNYYAGWAGLGRILAGNAAAFGAGCGLFSPFADAEAAAEAEEGSFFDGTSYSDKVLQQMQGDPGEFHSFPESVTAFEDSGTITEFTGNDGEFYQQLDIPGSYQSSNGTWYDGMFQFIKDSNGVINHRYFSPF